jgi:hypothetical protein
LWTYAKYLPWEVVMSFKERVRKFFIPEPGSSRWMWIPSLLVIGLISLGLLGGGVHAWEYSNSPEFCGTACHTMPPQSVTYLASPHVNVTCEECHIGRVSIPDQFVRKTKEGTKELFMLTFNLYEYPIRASALQPVRDTCERCHRPESFLGDSLRTITRFESDMDNTPYDIYLIMKTRGGIKQENQGEGIHWHITNKVEYYAVDPLEQIIPYVRVHNDDGTITEYIDVESDFDISTVAQLQLREMDCVSCHNRVSHNFKSPAESMDTYMARRLIDPAIPEIRAKGIEVLSKPYESQEIGLIAIRGLENYYTAYYSEFYSNNMDLIDDAISQIQKIYTETVFIEHKINWQTYPNNIGHMEDPGCFRCHDGKHLNAEQQAIRIGCNVCHSIPTVATPRDFLALIEISRGPEPESHSDANWISMHNEVFNDSCATCHSMEDPGGTSNVSFCSNTACHSNVYTYAGFDAPNLRKILQEQMQVQPTEEPPDPVTGTPSYNANIQELLVSKCAMCHGQAASAGLDVTTFEALMRGGDNGAVVIAGDPENSRLIEWQMKPHFANFTARELEFIRQWIEIGAPEE